MNLGILSQARLKVVREKKLVAYMLLAEDTSGTSSNPHKEDACDTYSFSKLGSGNVKLSIPKFHALASEVMDFFVTNGSILLQNYLRSSTDSVGGINQDIVHICVSFIIVAHAILSSPRFQDSGQKPHLESILNEMSESLKDCILYHNDQQDLIGGLYESFGAVLPPINKICSGDDLLANGVVKMSQAFDQSFWKRFRHSSDTANSHSEYNGLDLDDDFDPHRDKDKEWRSTMDFAHWEVPASSNATAFRACVAAKVCLMSDLRPGDGFEASLARTASSSVDYLTTMQGQNFLACRAVIVEILDSEIRVVEGDASTLFQYLAEVLLRSYEFERSEVSMGVILDVMTCLAEMWTLDEANDICNMGEMLYSWFIDTALRKGIASPHVHVCMSAMLQKIIKVRPEYGKSVPLPSARTSLFEVLRDGNVVAKFHIGSNIAEIFGLFILKEHEHILEDVIVSLPNDPNWIEGIALRLFVLSHLAASWSTLLRRCIYAILECPRHVPKSVGYANNCLQHITTSLKLADLGDLFKLFAPQIFYTWLETQPLKLFPYTIFGYNCFSDLLRDVQDEIVGQIVMRGKENEANQLASSLDLPFEQLLVISFSKASAYCIARDVAMPSSISSQAPYAEARIRTALGKDRYTSLVAEHFPTILAVLFKTTDPDGQVEKGFQKHSGAEMALSAYKDILSYSGQDKALPMNQQPSFKARYLFDEIDYLCRRANYDVESLWTPELYTFIFREIINSIHDALGSLHACSVIRRIRILVSMAGPVALDQYPLEMTLQSLKSYQTDAQCAEEAIGVAQYLLVRGAPYLREIPSFLAGYAVSTLTSMRAFFDSTQDSTTQESQFQATMSRIQNFHTWFGAYLEKYKSPNLSEESAKYFKAIVNAASHIQTGGNAKLGTYESELLLEVLEDQRSGRNLLDQSCRDSILKFLSTPFEVPLDFRDDILGSDESASQYASVVWKTCQRSITSTSYRTWAGRVLGRAYAGKGLVDREMVNETRYEPLIGLAYMQTTTASSSSRANLLALLCNILHDESSSKIGLAETTLRLIVTKTDGTEDFLECDQCLPTSLKKSLLWRQFHLPEEQIASQSNVGPQDRAILSKPVASKDWIQRLCVALVLTSTEDPILSELALILKSVEGLAENAFPYILHLVLLEEINSNQTTKRNISERCQHMFGECINKQDKVVASVRILLQAILYLRTQPLPNETSKDDRAQWLDIDYNQAAAAAIRCSMFKTALLFLELEFSVAAKLSRRSSAIKTGEPSDLLLAIYEKIDEQDAFYGIQQPSSLSSMMARLEYEHAGFKSLSFRGAHYDGQLRISNGENQVDEESMLRALDNLDLNGLSQSLLSKMTNTGPTATDSVLRTARKLEQWDISAPTSHVSSASTVFRTLQGIHSATDPTTLVASLDTGFSDIMDQLTIGRGAKSAVHEMLGSLAILTEADEIFSRRKSEQLSSLLGRFEQRDIWMRSERLVLCVIIRYCSRLTFSSYDHIKGILSCRETALSMLSKKAQLQNLLKITQRDARSTESHLLLASSQMSRFHGALQNALSTATYLTQLVTPCTRLDIDISAAVEFESAHILWGQGEMTASINILQDLNSRLRSKARLAGVGTPELLATLV